MIYIYTSRLSSPFETLSAAVVALALGPAHTCALLTGGGVDCWGYNNYGQLGTGDTTDRHTPTAVTGFWTGACTLKIAILRFENTVIMTICTYL